MREVLFSKYSMERSSQFAIRTSIVRDGGCMWVEKSPMTQEAYAHVEELVSSYDALCRIYGGTRVRPCPVTVENGVAKFEFLEGESFHEKLGSLIAEKDEEGILALCKEFVSIVRSGRVEKFRKTPEFVRIFGDVALPDGLTAMPFSNVDWIFENLIEKENGDIVLIDYEWCFDFPVPLEYVLYRSLYISFMYWGIPTFVDQILCPKMDISPNFISAIWQIEAGFTRYVARGEHPDTVWYGYMPILQRSYDWQKIQEQEKCKVQIFFDTGKGFNEEQSFTFYRLYNKDFELCIPVGAEVNNLRVDPVDGYAIVTIKKCCALCDEGVYDLAYQSNGIQIGNAVMFDTEDPQLWSSNLKDGISEIRLTLNVVQITTDVIENYGRQYYTAKEKLRENQELMRQHEELKKRQYEELKNELTQQREEECQRLTQQCEEIRHDLTQQCEVLRQQLALAQYNYNVVSNAFFWKITKPARVITDALKSVLKKNHYTWLFYKGLKCWKQNGFRYTWNKLMGYHGHNTQYKERMRNSAELDEQENVNVDGPTFSILTPLYNTPKKLLREMIESVLKQTYVKWELCLVDGGSKNCVGVICDEYAQSDSRIHYRRLDRKLDISEISNECASMSSGDFLVMLDQDGLLSSNALYENAKAILATQADVLYSDEDHITQEGMHVSPFFKPDWSPDLLYCQMYVRHLMVFRRELFFEIGGFRSQFNGSQDYDLMLRLTEKTERICHIPKVLYSWRESENSTDSPAGTKQNAYEAGKRALDEHLKRKYGMETYVEEYDTVYNARFSLTTKPFVSIIIPMRDKYDMTAECIKSILEKSSYKDFEILLLDNRSEKEETKLWLKHISLQDSRVHVVTADMEFNWSKLNNFGVAHANGDIFIFLNNDTLVISEDWIERLCENALRYDIGVVGALLLYPDETIQHAGVVVGMGKWADHVFKGMPLKRYSTPYVCPTLSRNVLAVTGACMAVSRTTWNKIGTFDEEFVICGSDVEYGIRAHEAGLFNRYDANVRLYHLESKSRDTYIPDIDFEKSYAAYAPYRENIDPFFNINLDTESVIPKENIASMDLTNFKNFLKRCPVTSHMYQEIKKGLMSPYSYTIPEITMLESRKSCIKTGMPRINLLIPTVDKNYIFGGISTAMKFFGELQKFGDWFARIIVLDSSINLETAVIPDGYILVDANQDDEFPLQILSVADRRVTLPVWEGDVFVATAWWSAYVIADVIRCQSELYNIKLQPLVYFIQDFEPGFYPWSSRYLMADSTYRLDIPTFAVMNTSILKNYFEWNHYSFAKVWSFEPSLNDRLRPFLPLNGQAIPKKKQILVYGRPTVARNAFELLVYALKLWADNRSDVEEWTLISAGEKHDDVDLGHGAILHSVGKLSLEDYAAMMLDTYAGISLMVSPHPSYPPLEMAAFGVQTITNCYANKNLSPFSKNIISLDSCGAKDVANALNNICNKFHGVGYPTMNSGYIDGSQMFSEIIPDILNQLERN